MDPRRITHGVRRGAARATGYGRRKRNAIRRAWRVDSDPRHLVPRPVFVLCPPRSGSTLLRSVLNAHPAICAPHEPHFNTARVTTRQSHATESWKEFGLSPDGLADLLWDRALHFLLVQSGKRIIVDKTPQNVMMWPRIHAFWPNARYIHLRRHPAAVIGSMAKIHPDRTPEQHVEWMLKYAQHLDAARAALPGPTVRYEELTAAPAPVLGELCRYLGVRYLPAMLSYRPEKRIYRIGLGDFSEKIASGRIQQAHPAPDRATVPSELHPLLDRWGY